MNLQNAKDFFKNKISKLIEKSGFVKLEEIYRKLTLQLKFNMYYIVDDFNVFVAFETMNNRGKRLSYLELLKNRLIYLSTLFDNDDDDKNKVREDINNTWKEIYGYLGKNKNRPLSDDEFLQNHWMIYFGHQTRKIQGNKTIPYHTFLLNKYFIQQNIDPNNMYIPDLSGMIFNEESAEELEIEFAENNAPDVYFGDDKQINLSLYEIQKYVNSLKELIQYWYDMYFPNEKYPSEMRKYLFRLNELGHVNARPLITVLLSKNNISDEEKIECLKNIERFNFLHYRLNGYSSTYSNSVFYNLARDLYYDTITINDVMNIVCRIDYLSDNNVIDTNGILEKFRKLFKRDGFYSWGTIKYLLYVYDISKTQTISEQRLDPTNYFKQDPKDYYSIEHIYPQKAVDIYWTERFDMYTEKERKTLSSSLGNLLPLSNRINSKLQNSSFDVKKERYSKGSRSEQLVAENKEWTPKIILERGLEILTFIEEEWNIKFPNLEHKKRILGLDFMIKENDITTDVNIPFYNEPEKEVKESRYDEEQFKKLVNNMKPEIMEIYADIDKYIMSLSNNVRKNTTSVYLAYTTTENFIELMFQTNGLKFIIMTGEYDDPRGLVGKLPDSYNWKNMRYIFAKTDSDLDYIKNILKQSYEMTLK